MLNNLLLTGMTPVQTGLFTFLLGLIVTFFGMFILVASVSLIGKALSSKDAKKDNDIVVLPDLSEERPVVTEETNDISDDIKVAIIAAISAYYSESQSKNEFLVKKIKRLK